MPRPAVERQVTATRAQGWLRLTTTQGLVHYLNLEQMGYIRLTRTEATFAVSTEDGLSEIGCFRLTALARKRICAILASPESSWIEMDDTGTEQRFLQFNLVVRVDYAQGAAGPLVSLRNGRQFGRVTSPGGQSRLRRLLAHAGIAADLEADERVSAPVAPV